MWSPNVQFWNLTHGAVVLPGTVLTWDSNCCYTVLCESGCQSKPNLVMYVLLLSFTVLYLFPFNNCMLIILYWILDCRFFFLFWYNKWFLWLTNCLNLKWKLKLSAKHSWASRGSAEAGWYMIAFPGTARMTGASCT